MSTPTHTPGPWIVCPDDDEPNNPHSLYVQNADSIIVHLYRTNDSSTGYKERTAADAALIASAPALLEEVIEHRSNRADYESKIRSLDEQNAALLSALEAQEDVVAKRAAFERASKKGIKTARADYDAWTEACRIADELRAAALALALARTA